MKETKKAPAQHRHPNTIYNFTIVENVCLVYGLISLILIPFGNVTPNTNLMWLGLGMLLVSMTLEAIMITTREEVDDDEAES